MCGLVGIVGSDYGRSDVERMTDCLRHRGPDDHGVWAGDGVLLGHRRLSILDLSSAGHQPMSFGDYTIVYNGEIYNFRQLRKQLPGPFRSNSDTEVLLHLYARDGHRFLERLEGMFALAIWDRAKRTLFAARDRLGIKPFYYRELRGGLAFASELKALLELDRPAIDATAVRDFFTYKYVPTPKSIYRGIRKLPPAHTLEFDGELRIRRYWQPAVSRSIVDEDEALERLAPLLAGVVRDHMVSDVPVGLFLSGGIDSTTLAANLERTKAFTLGWDVKVRDEIENARRTAVHFGAEHRSEVAQGVDLEEALESMPGLYDEPFGDHGSWAVHLVSRLARREVKVALTGEGGDEAFAGYHWYTKWPRRRWPRLNAVLARLLPVLSRLGRSCQRRAAFGLERYAMYLSPFTPAQKRALLVPDLLDPENDDLWYFRRFWREDLDPVKRLQWVDLHTYLVDDMLTKVDRASMAVSLEARPPFVDHRIVEFVFSLDSRLLHDGEQGKVLLRRYLRPRVPPETLNRPKIGFSMPVRRWVRQRPELIRGCLRRLHQAGILRPVTFTGWNSEQAWCLMVLDRWLRQSGAAL